MFDICIIGGGAAGLTAAITAKRLNSELNIVILEKKEKVGKKILASGNGKCNISNVNCKGYLEILEFFESVGVITRTDEEGRIYPYSEESKAVVRGLSNQLLKLGISVLTECQVKGIEKKDCYEISYDRKIINARKILIACGGKAAPKLGTTGDGYRWAKEFGHSVSKLAPALTAVKVSEDVKSLKGVREKCRVKLFYMNEVIFQEDGELQFTEDGISGICVFNMTRFMRIPEGKKLENGFEDYRIVIDFLPEINRATDLLKQRRKMDIKGLDSLVKEPLGNFIEKIAGEIMENEEKLLKTFYLSPIGLKGWDFAQITKGGVDMNQIHEDTMESKLVTGLYFAGEILNYDGPCGGYNLNFAWKTGMIAGRNMADV